MCGFVGIISKTDKPFDKKTLQSMTAMINHRGPDDEGFFFHEEWLAMGFKRLSILDLSAKGHQPMVSQCGNYSIVFNGEVYNYKEIREELIAKGYSFVSDSDTEVVLSAFQCWGKEAVHKFIGMFAFVAVNLETKEAFIARDQLGIKPLFFYEDSHFYIFCSEVKSLLPYTTLEPNFGSYEEYLVFRSVIGRNTMFKNVNSLRQGYSITYKNKSLTEQCYYDLSSTLTPDNSMGFEEACEKSEQTFIDSVKLHLRSDVELGVQLSGGVDSSLISAIASKELGKKFHSFSISFAESDYDESEYQQRVSERYGTVHHDYQLDENIFIDAFQKSIWYYEHPLNDPNGVATYYLCERAKKHITVMLSGEGADESFLGYARFNPESIAILKRRNILYRNPALRKTLKALWPIKKGKDLFNVTAYDPAMYVLTYAKMKYVDDLLNGNDNSIEFRKSVTKMAKGNVTNEAILQDQICDLMQWFWRADRMGMGSSMELRVPFCTVPMFELANSIPYEKRLHGGMRKAVLKKVAEKYIDHDQIYRKKVGFGTPVDVWINREGKYSDMFRNLMESGKFKNREHINYDHFNRLYKAHKEGTYRERNSGFLWTYFNFEMWYRIFFEDGWKELI